MRGERGFQRAPEFINGRGELGLRWFASVAIGQRWRCFWMALWSECRGIGDVVSGVLVRSLVVHFQRRCGRCGAWQGRLRCTTRLGEGGIVTVPLCRAGVCEVQGQRRSQRTGMACPLWALWAARWRCRGTTGRWCTVGLAGFCFRELDPWVVTVLAAR
jgi:hypothetical protein